MNKKLSFTEKIVEDANYLQIKNLTSTSKVLIHHKNLSSESINENDIITLLIKIENLIKITPKITKIPDDDQLKSHEGGKQTLVVFEADVGDRKFAVKIYKPIVSHLLIHTLASNYLTYMNEFSSILNKYNFFGALKFPKTYAIKLTEEVSQKVILVQDWVEESSIIYKKYPETHIQLLGDLVKKISTYKLMVDIMGKNWLICNKNHLHYIDLILFNPTEQITAIIKDLQAKLQFS